MILTKNNYKNNIDIIQYVIKLFLKIIKNILNNTNNQMINLNRFTNTKKILTDIKNNIDKCFIYSWNNNLINICNMIITNKYTNIYNIFKKNMKNCVLHFIKHKYDIVNETCSICYEKTEIITNCNHQYCYNCLYNDVSRIYNSHNSKCSICRSIINNIYFIN